VVLEPRALLPAHPGTDALIATAWLVLVTAAGPVLGAVSLRRIETRLASAILLLNPLSASVLAVLLLGERLSPLQIAGGVLVLAGMAVAGWRDMSNRRRASKGAAAAVSQAAKR
jgi:drug/metabolite transporter (DMT)-like permease